MGQFGYRICQDDASLDIMDTLRDEGYGEALSWLGTTPKPDMNYWDLNGWLTLGAIVAESRGLRVTREWYCSSGDMASEFLDNAGMVDFSNEEVETVLNDIVLCRKYLEANKEDAVREEFNGTSLYDDMGVENGVEFKTMYEFLHAASSELIELLQKCKKNTNSQKA